MKYETRWWFEAFFSPRKFWGRCLQPFWLVHTFFFFQKGWLNFNLVLVDTFLQTFLPPYPHLPSLKYEVIHQMREISTLTDGFLKSWCKMMEGGEWWSMCFCCHDDASPKVSPLLLDHTILLGFKKWREVPWLVSCIPWLQALVSGTQADWSEMGRGLGNFVVKTRACCC